MTPVAARDDAAQRGGVLFGLLAFSLWGVFPVYFKWIESVAPLEVLGHRVLWAVPFGAMILTLRGQWREVAAALVDRRMLAWLALAALSISLNWLVYIWAVQNERILETSLGYYINPLMFVAIGTFVFGERLRRFQAVAVTLAAAGVLFLTISGGAFPWVALSLAALFAAYGIIRRQIAIGAMPGLFIETSLLLPIAAIWIAWLMSQGEASITSGDAGLAGLLVLGGPITVLPLLFFAIAAKRVSLTAIGFMQFLAPSMQFAIGLYYGEPLTLAHKICFACIWLAAAFFIYDAVSGKKEAE
ncbi:MAG: EamA family transporter RarD [Gammaproteobacteria bacterium]|nr:EamA family transporter RarD [Gammaproteobacteria bacterium]MBT8105765.1 EamA family transporter RarD [Gammaproteobacteria bacterium]NNF49000.1 EamA family transporter RarD [Woeseiaceae bacterium]NNK25779.1 EamA family transporter RarD [Woeseiaceae bacterium]NNL63020.1 EamA family transporter RarD [Woeseiaceae bacterium]